MKAKGFAVFAALCGLAAALPWAGKTASAGEYDGVTVNIMTFTGPQIAEPLQRRAARISRSSPAPRSTSSRLPFSDLYQKLLTDWAARHQQHRRRCCSPPQWMFGLRLGGISGGHH